MFILALALAAATADKPGSHDYPLIQRFPHQYISQYEQRDWDMVKFGSQEVGGHRLQITYGMEKGADHPSDLEWSRNYENALTGAGWSVQKTRDAEMIAHLDKGGHEVWARLTYFHEPGNSHFDIVEKGPMPMILEAGKATPPTPGGKPEQGKDYDGVPRLPGQHLDSFEERKFDSFDFHLASGPRHRVEGRKTVRRYSMTKGQKLPSDAEEKGNYAAVLAAEGWTVLSQSGPSLSAVLNDKDRQTWVEIEYNPYSGSSAITIVEPAEFKQQVSASNLVDQLKREGHVAFQVHFDSGQDVIKDESKPVIAQMIEMLKSDPQLKVEVQGHTDALGNPQADLALSERRAKAVMAQLVGGGIDASRLTAKGYGLTRPIADNDTEGGRALNRRVELSKR